MSEGTSFVGIPSQMGHPAAGPVSTFPNNVKEAILHLRTLHPGWGAATLLVALQTDANWCEQPLSSQAHMATLLKQAGSRWQLGDSSSMLIT